MQLRKLVKTFAVIPVDSELSTQYCETLEEAEYLVNFIYNTYADIVEMEQFQDVIDRKALKTARDGYEI